MADRAGDFAESGGGGTLPALRGWRLRGCGIAAALCERMSRKKRRDARPLSVFVKRDVESCGVHGPPCDPSGAKAARRSCAAACATKLLVLYSIRGMRVAAGLAQESYNHTTWSVRPQKPISARIIGRV